MANVDLVTVIMTNEFPMKEEKNPVNSMLQWKKKRVFP